jgi:alkanesulfonate monooxygenase SsuD/methylene tetrahydromethanopterin reductase-like flavin-dependent oxidoreductase (luciferase family)
LAPVGTSPNIALTASSSPQTRRDEYNIVYPTLEKVREARVALEDAWEQENRDPESLVLSAMAGCVVGETDEDFRGRAEALIERTGSDGSFADWYAEATKTQVVGTVDQVSERLGQLAEAGVDRVMLQHLNHTDVEMVSLIGERVAPTV